MLFSVHTMLARAWQNEVLRTAITDKLPLTDVLRRPLLGRPHFVLESTSLALLVHEGAGTVGAWAELAGRLDVSELAVGHLALAAVAAGRHGRVPEGAVRVGAVGKELAVLFALVRHLGGRRRVPANALAVFAGYAEAAHIIDVDRGTRWGRGGLVGKLAILVLAPQVEPADGIIGVRGVALGS